MEHSRLQAWTIALQTIADRVYQQPHPYVGRAVVSVEEAVEAECDALRKCPEPAAEATAYDYEYCKEYFAYKARTRALKFSI